MVAAPAIFISFIYIFIFSRLYSFSFVENSHSFRIFCICSSFVFFISFTIFLFLSQPLSFSSFSHFLSLLPGSFKDSKISLKDSQQFTVPVMITDQSSLVGLPLGRSGLTDLEVSFLILLFSSTHPGGLSGTFVTRVRNRGFAS